MGDIRVPIVHIDPPDAVPFAHGDGPFPGHGAESVGFQVDVGHRPALGIEDMDPDVLPLAHGVHALVQVALEQDGLALEGVTGPIGAPVQEDASVEVGRRDFNILRPLVDGEGRTPPLPDPRLQGGGLLADHPLEIRRQGREAVQGNLPLKNFIPALETERGRRDRLSGLVIRHIHGKVIPLPPDRHRECMLLVGNPCVIFCRDGIGTVRKRRDRPLHRVQGIKPPVLVPEGDLLLGFVRSERQRPAAEVPAGQEDGVVLEGDPQPAGPEGSPEIVHRQVHTPIGAFHGLGGLDEGRGIVKQGLGLCLRGILVFQDPVETHFQDRFLGQIMERVVGILLRQRLHRGHRVLRPLGQLILQIRAGRIPVADLFGQEAELLRGGGKPGHPGHAFPEDPFEIVGDVIDIPGLHKGDPVILQIGGTTGRQFLPMGLGVFPVIVQPAEGEEGLPVGFHDFQQGGTQGILRFPVLAGVDPLLFPAGFQQVVRELAFQGDLPDFVQFRNLVTGTVLPGDPLVFTPLLLQFPGRQVRDEEDEKQEEKYLFHSVASSFKQR